MGGFWAELKRRNVVKVGIAYCAAGWLAIQVASVLFPMFGAPAWILKVVTTLVILGLPLALVFAVARNGTIGFRCVRPGTGVPR